MIHKLNTGLHILGATYVLYLVLPTLYVLLLEEVKAKNAFLKRKANQISNNLSNFKPI